MISQQQTLAQTAASVYLWHLLHHGLLCSTVVVVVDVVEVSVNFATNVWDHLFVAKVLVDDVHLLLSHLRCCIPSAEN